MTKDIRDTILKERVVGIVGSVNEGKTTAMFDFIDFIKKSYKTKIVCYFYHEEYKHSVKGVSFAVSIEELELVENSFIFIDEFTELFDLDNRHFRKQVERMLNMLIHNNNVIVLCGLPSYYKKFISSRIKAWVFKSLRFAECINGSLLKSYINGLSGDFVGASRLRVPLNCFMFRGAFYKVDYNKEYDKKANNKDLFKEK